MRNLLKSLTEADYYKNANLHIHTNFSDGKLHPSEIIKLAVNKNLKYISITDHNTLDAYKHISPTQLCHCEELATKQSNYPMIDGLSPFFFDTQSKKWVPCLASNDGQILNDLKILTGIEFDCWYKSNFMHILGYGIDLNNEDLNNLCAKNSNETKLDIVRIFTSRKAPEVIKTIKNAGGIAVIAHPCCCWNINIKKMIEELKNFGLDGVEVYYPYIRHRAIVKFHTIKEIKAVAEELNLLITGGTDCHSDDL